MQVLITVHRNQPALPMIKAERTHYTYECHYLIAVVVILAGGFSSSS
jgi:hypothetical protein